MSRVICEREDLEAVADNIRSMTGTTEKMTLAAMATASGNGTTTGGGANIDVVAEVGQTFRVKEVDANGKVTAVEAADYQEKICETKMAFIVPEQECILDEDMGLFMAQGNATLTEGKTYNVTYNGTSYTCEAVVQAGEGGQVMALGNVEAMVGTGDNGMPFVIIDASSAGMTGVFAVAPFDGAESVTLSIEGEVVEPIPVHYVTNALPFYIELAGLGTDENPFVCNKTAEDVANALNSERLIIVSQKYYLEKGIINRLYHLIYFETSEEFGIFMKFATAENIYGNQILRLQSQEDGSISVSFEI